MRVATVDGLVTLFYDGSKQLYNGELEDEWITKWRQYDRNYQGWEDWDLSDECKQYWRERQSWQQIIIEEGVTVIPDGTFLICRNIKRVIFADTVVRIKEHAFYGCIQLISLKLPIRLEVIGQGAFNACDLSSVFIPPSCRDIYYSAFALNRNLEICHVPQQTRIGDEMVFGTKLIEESQFEIDQWGHYHHQIREVNHWLKNINRNEKYSLHRACSSFQPLKEVIHTIIQLKGIGDFKTQNEIDTTPSQYLKENPYCDLKEIDIIRDYVMKMMGENE
ncbi:hypothetical protein CTEN210_02771 [Chaetoceros tenuissimus]|uniref:Leucine-rich repeat domain-containing protein n=1 Tax=Chaetoceros tenuissimus TaxID=426638 RepID=A0AAD3CHP3_9STRA|nr:hypothetical protein CTEN210_02771 [Chaetoceros tenuissimus]